MIGVSNGALKGNALQAKAALACASPSAARLGTAIGALAFLAGIAPGTIAAAGAVDQGQILILGNGKGKATGPIMVKPAGGGQIKATIIVPGEANGEVRLTGLKPGDYEVEQLPLTAAAPVRNSSMMKVGPDGNLAFRVRREVTGLPDAKAIDPRARRALPGVREWFEPIPELKGASVIIALLAARGPGVVDVNTSSAAELQRGTSVTPQAAALIVADRTRNGAYKGFADFAERVCTKTAVDFSDASIRAGEEALLVNRGSDPKNPGFKCAQGTGTIDLYGTTYQPRQLQFGMRLQF